MQLPPGLPGRLGPGPGGGPCGSPPLPVLRHPASGTAPFRFAPRAQSLPRGHPLFEDGDVQRHAYLRDVIRRAWRPREPRGVAAFGCHVAGCPQEFGSLAAFEHHYGALHTHVCAECARAFPSARLLDVHVLEWHDALFQLQAARRPALRCPVEGCPATFGRGAQRSEHLVRAHRYPPDFRFDPPPAPAPARARARASPRSVPAAVCFGRGAEPAFPGARP